MFLEVDADAKGFQFPDRFQALRGVSGKPGYGFYQHLIDASLSAIRKKALEILPSLCGSTGDPFIRIDINQLPLVMCSDHFSVMIVLCGEAVDLVI